MAKTVLNARILATLDYAPTDSEENFKAWCEKHGFDCFGLEIGRRAWCSPYSTYLRDALGVATTNGGEESFLFYKEDLADV